MGRKNLNALEWIQRQKVGVAGDHVGSMAAHREFEELVVLRVAASSDLYIHVNPFGLAR